MKEEPKRTPEELEQTLNLFPEKKPIIIGTTIKPVHYRGFTYVTDKNCLVRIPGEYGDKASEETGVAYAGMNLSFLDDAENGEDPPLDDFTRAEEEFFLDDTSQAACRFCRDIDYPVRDTCYQCEGKGYTICHCGEEHDCPECQGTGREVFVPSSMCWHCYGTKITRNGVQVFGKRMNLRYLLLLSKKLPWLKFYPQVPEETHSPPLLYFKFKGGSGVLCGMKEQP